MLITRLAKIAMCLSLAIFCVLVGVDNISDPKSNYAFVVHVMSMDTTFPGNKLMYRAITSPLAWQIAFAMIIATEIVAGILFLIGSWRMWRARFASAAEFNSAKAYAIAGALLAFLLWFFVFMVIAGEWFAMWQSKDWNAQQSAFRLALTVLAVLIFLVQPDGELPKPASATGKRKER
jgi:predicted small integral membrane protein